MPMRVCHPSVLILPILMKRITLFFDIYISLAAGPPDEAKPGGSVLRCRPHSSFRCVVYGNIRRKGVGGIALRAENVEGIVI